MKAILTYLRSAPGAITGFVVINMVFLILLILILRGDIEINRLLIMLLD